MKIFLSVFLFYILSGLAFSQSTTFIKRYSFNSKESESSRSLLLDKKSIYVNVASICDNEFCTLLVKIDSFGKEVFVRPFIAEASNRNTMTQNDSLVILSAMDRSTESGRNFLYQTNKFNGDSLDYFQIPIKKEWNGGAIDGCIYNKESIFLYGWANSITDGGIGYIQKIDLHGKLIFEKQYRNPDNNQSSIFDLKIGRDSLLYFIQYVQSKTEGDFRKITSINGKGDVVKEVNYGHGNTGIYLPVGFTLTNEDDFVFTAWQPDSIFDGEDTPQIVRTKKTGQLIWNFNWPSKFFGAKEQYTISDVQMTKNGDVIGCGYIEKGWHDAYLFRLSGSGDLLWERRYNIKDNLDDKLDILSLSNLDEDIDGNIIAAGSHYNSSTKVRKVLVIKTNGDGCIDSLGCNYRSIIEDSIVGINERLPSDMTVFPNPFKDYIDLSRLDFEKVKSILVHDALGRPVFTEHKNIPHQINTVNWKSGLYFIKLMLSENNYMTLKVVK